MKKLKFLIWVGLVAGFLAISQPSAAYADTLDETFTIDTSSLAGQSNYTLVFVLIDGSQTGDGNTTVTISAFGFGAGGSNVSLVDPTSLTDNNPFNDALGSFNPGSQLSFNVDIQSSSLDYVPMVGYVPDVFEVGLLDPNGNAVPTTDAVGDTLVTVTVDSLTNPTVSSYAIVAPEPGSLLLLATGLLMGIFLFSRRTC